MDSEWSLSGWRQVQGDTFAGISPGARRVLAGWEASFWGVACGDCVTEELSRSKNPSSASKEKKQKLGNSRQL